MSKEATGQLGVKLGSSAYWTKLNNAAGLNTLTGSEPNYYRMLQQTGNRASAAIDEIYDDLATQGSKIRYLSSSNRNALAKQVEGLYDVCKMTGVTSSHSSDCIYALNMSALSPWLDPFRDERAIDRAISIINTQSHFSTSEALKLLDEGSKWSVSFVAGGDKMKEALLQAVLQGKSNSAFLQEVVNEYQHRNTIQHFTAKCGYEIGSSAYLEHFEAQVFGTSISASNNASFGNPDYDGLLRDSLRSVADQLEYDLDEAARQNDYITDNTADVIKEVVNDLHSCGVSTGSIHGKIDKLAWFVGGDRSKILRLQKDLKALGFGDQLTEDGVYGNKTNAAWLSFLRIFETGTVPTLRWVDILQTEKTNITTEYKIDGGNTTMHNAFVYDERIPYIRFDPPHNGGKTFVRGVKKKVDYNHINFLPMDDAGWLYNQLRKNFDHSKLPDSAYNILKDLKQGGKVVRKAGRKFLVGGLALDALELGVALHADFKDTNNKLDKTMSAAISIGGSWAGATVGAKIGAALGLATGLASPIAIPVLSIGGGIVGSIGGSLAGDKLSQWVVDITDLEG